MPANTKAMLITNTSTPTFISPRIYPISIYLYEGFIVLYLLANKTKVKAKRFNIGEIENNTHAIMNIMEPIWTKIFTRDTYSCIKGRGIHSLV